MLAYIDVDSVLRAEAPMPRQRRTQGSMRHEVIWRVRRSRWTLLNFSHRPLCSFPDRICLLDIEYKQAGAGATISATAGGDGTPSTALPGTDIDYRPVMSSRT
jgi:hypothetical protein